MRSAIDPSLPIVPALPALVAALADHCNAVLQAPPGAGKSTGVPLALLDAAWLDGLAIVMLEPRRLAARAVANRMAALLGERVGETVGYRMRMDTKVGPRTRIEVVTEGILTRRIQQDPALEDVGCLIFDEYHERSLQADLGLALARDAQKHLRPGLRLLVMSATLDGTAVARFLGDAPLVVAEGRSFPVETRYSARATSEHLDRQAAAAVRRALREEAGDVLVFLPGAGEIRRVERLLAEGGADPVVRVMPLYGDLGQEDQDLAIRPSEPGCRKVVLATNIAETSLTIEGVRVVVDAGFERRARFDPASGMSRLDTVRISRASADQRRGRAGRLAPGVCYRLWTEAEQRSLAAHAPPEIVAADLAPLALELACWGADDALALDWLDPPPPATINQARDLLARLGALDPDGRVTTHGRDMARLGAHPRIAHMLLQAKAAGLAATGAALAALLTERDVLRGPTNSRDADLRTRLALLDDRGAAGGGNLDRQAVQRVRRTASFFGRQLGARDGDGPVDPDEAGWLLASAYPDRIGRWREPGSGRYQLCNGRGAFFAEPQSLARAEYLVIPELDAGEREARIFLAAPLALMDIEAHFGTELVTDERVYWDSREQAVRARRQRRFGELLLADDPLPRPDPLPVATALLAGIRELGVGTLPWDRDTRSWQARVLLLRAEDAGAKEAWPDVSDAALLAGLEQWLAAWLPGIRRREHFSRIDLAGALRAQLSFDQQRKLDQLAPTHLTVPSGSRVPIDYLEGGVPSLAVRLQEVFGLRETPSIAGGRIPVLLKLLSPARRPVQVTRDLRSFWEKGYHEVKKELKGRYPRHYWPDDPYQAEPTRRVRPKKK